MMSVDEIKAILETAPEEGAEDTRVETVVSEMTSRDDRIAELEGSVTELTNKVTELVDVNKKLAETVKYAEPDVEDEVKEEDKYEFADLTDIYEED